MRNRQAWRDESVSPEGERFRKQVCVALSNCRRDGRSKRERERESEERWGSSERLLCRRMQTSQSARLRTGDERKNESVRDRIVRWWRNSHKRIPNDSIYSNAAQFLLMVSSSCISTHALSLFLALPSLSESGVYGPQSLRGTLGSQTCGKHAQCCTSI